jgi:hypothetical protein
MRIRHLLSCCLIPMVAGAAEPAPTGTASGKTPVPAAKATHKTAQKPAHKVRHKAAAVAPALAPTVTEVVPEEHKLAVAGEVHTGRMACELGVHVSVNADPQKPGEFVLQMQQHTYRMTPVVSSTGAVRLEDAKAGAMWLQLANKSMLMNTKLGQRMADECQSPAQMAVAEQMKLNPPPSLLDDPGVARK